MYISRLVIDAIARFEAGGRITRSGPERTFPRGSSCPVLARAILADLSTKDRPGVRVIAAAHGVSVNTVQRIAHAQ